MEHDIIIITSTGKIGSREKVSIGPIARALMTHAGKQALAAAMVRPLRTTLDYHGLARRVLTITPLPRDEENV